MYEPLIPCPACRRHVRAEAACPFCKSALPSDVRAVPSSSTRLGRGALFAFAVSVAACGGSTESDPPTTTTDTGAAKSDTGTTTDTGGGSDTSVDDTGGPVAAYGAPADTGVVDTGPADTGPKDDGGPAPAYGLPPSDAM